MTYEHVYDTITLVATGDNSAKQHHVVELFAGQICGFPAADNGGYGVLKNKPQNGEAATVAIGGTTKIQAGAAITAGNWVRTQSGGAVVAISSGDTIPFTRVGRALDSVASGDTVPVTLDFTRISEQSSGSIIGDV